MFTPLPSGASNFTLRDANADDLRACGALDASYDTDYAWQTDMGESGGVHTVGFRPIRLPRSVRVQPPRDMRILTALLDPQVGMILLLEQNGVIAAYLAARTDQAHRTAWIIDCTVARMHRRKGYATALYRAAYARAAAAQLMRITAETQSKNYAAITFYQRMGLTLCGYNDRYYPNYDIALFFGAMLHE